MARSESGSGRAGAALSRTSAPAACARATPSSTRGSGISSWTTNTVRGPNSAASSGGKRGRRAVRPRHDHDGVLAGPLHHDESRPGRLVDPGDRRGVDPLGAHRLQQQVALRVTADSARESGARSGPGGRDGLVEALASRVLRASRAQDRLARGGMRPPARRRRRSHCRAPPRRRAPVDPGTRWARAARTRIVVARRAHRCAHPRVRASVNLLGSDREIVRAGSAFTAHVMAAISAQTILVAAHAE